MAAVGSVRALEGRAAIEHMDDGDEFGEGLKEDEFGGHDMDEAMADL